MNADIDTVCKRHGYTVLSVVFASARAKMDNAPNMICPSSSMLSILVVMCLRNLCLGKDSDSLISPCLVPISIELHLCRNVEELRT